MQRLRVNHRHLLPLVATAMALASCNAPLLRSAPTPELVEATPGTVPTLEAIQLSATPTETPPAPTEESDAVSPLLMDATPVSTGEPTRCLEMIERHELDDPFRTPNADPRYTLSMEQFSEYLNLMGIETLCIPVEFGMPYLGVDWNDLDDPPIAIGRRVRIGFENQFRGIGQGAVHVVYATYDFAVGSEYEIFATDEDLEMVKAKSSPNPIEVDGVAGFMRYHPGLPMGMARIYKTYVFPFETYNIAIVLNLGSYDYDKVEEVVRDMELGNHPDLLHPNVQLIGHLVSSIHFSSDSR